MTSAGSGEEEVKLMGEELLKNIQNIKLEKTSAMSEDEEEGVKFVDEEVLKNVISMKLEMTSDMSEDEGEEVKLLDEELLKNVIVKLEKTYAMSEDEVKLVDEELLKNVHNVKLEKTSAMSEDEVKLVDEELLKNVHNVKLEKTSGMSEHEELEVVDVKLLRNVHSLKLAQTSALSGDEGDEQKVVDLELLKVEDLGDAETSNVVGIEVTTTYFDDHMAELEVEHEEVIDYDFKELMDIRKDRNASPTPASTQRSGEEDKDARVKEDVEDKFIQHLVEQGNNDILAKMAEEDASFLNKDKEQEDSSGESSDPDSNYSEEEVVSAKRKQTRASKKSERKRGKRFKNLTLEAESGDEELVSRIFNEQYKTAVKDTLARCPHPAPNKIRGGRKTLMKKVMENEIPEVEVQSVCSIIKNRKSLRPAEGEDVSGQLASSDGPFAQAMLQIKLQKLFNMKFQDAVSQNEFATMEFMRLGRPTLPLRGVFLVEHFNCIAEAALNDMQQGQGDKHCGPKVEEWMREFLDLANQKKAYVRQWKGYSPFTFNQMAEAQSYKVFSYVVSLGTAYNKVCHAMIAFQQQLNVALEAKQQLAEKLEDLHYGLIRRGQQFDELSISGIRLVKMILDPPYFKTTDGLIVAPTPFEDSEIPSNQSWYFRWDKQKWTTKDLQALKQCMKESIINRWVETGQGRYHVLLRESNEKKAKELQREGKGRTLQSLNQSVVKRRRGRPTKEEVEQRDKYGVIHLPLMSLPGGMKCTYSVTPKEISDWRVKREKRWRAMNFEHLINEQNPLIVDWNSVSEAMMIKTRKQRNAIDCELAFKHEVDPKIVTKRWTTDETRRLKALVEKHSMNWTKVAAELNEADAAAGRPIRTTYQCFFRYRNKVDPPKRLEWTDTMDKQVVQKLEEFPAQWRKVAASMENDAATKRVVMERFKKNINPMLITGSFTRVEDALLVLTIEKLKPLLAQEGHFGSLFAYLPWRYETTWRDRANNLFNDWIVPWTIEEDRTLLLLAVEMNRNWQKISEEFSSFKNRKGCLTRFKILQRNLKDPRYNSLEEYHEAYSMTRYNVFQYRHLKEILALLIRIHAQNVSAKEYPFPGLKRNEQPSERLLRFMLLVYDKEILLSTIKSLQAYSASRNQYWQDWLKKYGKRRRTFDRRTFHRDDPQSVASALHIRGLQLVDKKKLQNVNDFENEIYLHFGRFNRTKALGDDVKRPYIPSAKDLISWSVISRIVSTKVDDIKENEDSPANRKWMKPRKKYTLRKSEAANGEKSTRVRASAAIKIPKLRKDGTPRKVYTRKNVKNNPRKRRHSSEDDTSNASFSDKESDEDFQLKRPVSPQDGSRRRSTRLSEKDKRRGAVNMYKCTKKNTA